MKRKEVGNVLLLATDGVARYLTDTVLFLFFLYGESFGKRGPQGVYRAFEDAQIDLSNVNYNQIKRAINNLTKDKFLTRSPKRSQQAIEISREGLQRIRRLFPSYQTKRTWDGYVYLISYDIPKKANTKRDTLRAYIHRTGGALLQESLWVHPYNPHALLEEFAKTHHIEGTILISKLGIDSTIGSETLQDLLVRVYHFKDLSERYQEFIHEYTSRKDPPLFQVTFAYHAILKDDPQLPFPLEPKNFPAKTAHDLYQKIRNHYLLS